MPQNNLSEEQAAITLQSFWRSQRAQRKFSIKHMPKHEMRSGPAFLVGNEPKILGLDKYKVNNGKIALVGTSCLRSLWMSCELSSSQHTPKLIIVDNSPEVVTIWRNLRDFVTENNFTSPDMFCDKFQAFLSQNKALYRDLPDDIMQRYDMAAISYERQNPIDFISMIIAKHGLKAVTDVIAHTSVIAGSWTDPQLFCKLKNILNYNEITNLFAYPSNIAHCEFYKHEAVKVFKNINTLAPNASIITDLNYHASIPCHVFITSEKYPEKLMKTVSEYNPIGKLSSQL